VNRVKEDPTTIPFTRSLRNDSWKNVQIKIPVHTTNNMVRYFMYFL